MLNVQTSNDKAVIRAHTKAEHDIEPDIIEREYGALETHTEYFHCKVNVKYIGSGSLERSGNLSNKEGYQ